MIGDARLDDGPEPMLPIDQAAVGIETDGLVVHLPTARLHHASISLHPGLPERSVVVVRLQELRGERRVDVQHFEVGLIVRMSRGLGLDAPKVGGCFASRGLHRDSVVDQAVCPHWISRKSCPVNVKTLARG
jgi:hypothetical protein